MTSIISEISACIKSLLTGKAPEKKIDKSNVFWHVLTTNDYDFNAIEQAIERYAEVQPPIAVNHVVFDLIINDSDIIIKKAEWCNSYLFRKYGENGTPYPEEVLKHGRNDTLRAVICIKAYNKLTDETLPVDKSLFDVNTLLYKANAYMNETGLIENTCLYINGDDVKSL